MQQLSVDMMRETGAYVGPPVKREITWLSPDGKKHSAFIFVKLRSYETEVRGWEIQAEGSDVMVAKIVSSVVDETGNAIFTAKDIQGDADGNGKLCTSLFVALLSTINEANGHSREEEVKN